MKITAKTAAVILPLFLLIGIVATMSVGYWQTETTKEPVRFTSGEFEGMANPADIRGSYSFGDVEKAFGIPAEITARAFGMSDAEYPDGIEASLFEELFGFVGEWEIGTDSLRLFVSRYKGLPYDPEETTGLPRSAFDVLMAEDKLNPEEGEELSRRLVSLEGIEIDWEAVTASEEDHGETPPDTAILGKTTFGDLYSWGLTEGQVSEALGGAEPGPRAMPVRDYCEEIDLDFSALKEALQPLLDEL